MTFKVEFRGALEDIPFKVEFRSSEEENPLKIEFRGFLIGIILRLSSTRGRESFLQTCILLSLYLYLSFQQMFQNL